MLKFLTTRIVLLIAGCLIPSRIAAEDSDVTAKPVSHLRASKSSISDPNALSYFPEESILEESKKKNNNKLLKHRSKTLKPHKDPEEGLDLFEGDIIPVLDEIREDYGTALVEKLRKQGILPKKEEEEGLQGRNGEHEGGVLLNHRWTNRVKDVIEVQYEIEIFQFRYVEKKKIEEYITELANRAGVVKFVPVKDKSDDYLSVQKSHGCASYIGDANVGKQSLLLASECITKGTVQHEFMHALGFYHEQSLADRDEYIKVNTENIDPYSLPQFEKRNDGDNLGSKYDYGSVLHYPKDAFSKNGRDTITTLNGAYIGQREEADDMDIVQIRLLYQCISGPRTLADYKENMCTTDCPCWKNAVGCTGDDTCQDGLHCSTDNKCESVHKHNPKMCMDLNIRCKARKKMKLCFELTTRLVCRKSCDLC